MCGEVCGEGVDGLRRSTTPYSPLPNYRLGSNTLAGKPRGHPRHTHGIPSHTPHYTTSPTTHRPKNGGSPTPQPPPQGEEKGEEKGGKERIQEQIFSGGEPPDPPSTYGIDRPTGREKRQERRGRALTSQRDKIDRDS